MTSQQPNLDPEFEYAQDLSILRDDERLILAFESWEGPIDALLHLAREQKIDMAMISIVALVDQYIAFVRRAEGLRMELAADYLVMASWLVYLKSKLLLPEPAKAEQGDGAEIARDLAFHLHRLDAMRQAGQALFERDLLNQKRFASALPESITISQRLRVDCSLKALLSSYAHVVLDEEKTDLYISRPEIYGLEDALEHLRAMVADKIPDWRQLREFLPQSIRTNMGRRSAYASTFFASLELARVGQIDLQQSQAFDTVSLRSAREAKGELI